MKTLIKVVLFWLASGAIAVAAQEAADQTAASSPPAPSFPCEDDPRFSEFDFWVGSWDVHLADGTYAGSNVISREEHGCVLTENWTGAQGSTGVSINYLDGVSNKWVQIWHAASGYQIDMRGGLTPDGMLLVGNIYYISTEKSVPFRALFTALPDGRVRQFMETSQDDGKSWDSWFEGFYTRKPEQ